jgi:hypothetical protein
MVDDEQPVGKELHNLLHNSEVEEREEEEQADGKPSSYNDRDEETREKRPNEYIISSGDTYVDYWSDGKMHTHEFLPEELIDEEVAVRPQKAKLKDIHAGHIHCSLLSNGKARTAFRSKTIDYH